MARTGFKIVPKMIGPNVCEFYIVLSTGESKKLAEVLFPCDGQMNDNVIAAEEISRVIQKRIRKSV